MLLNIFLSVINNFCFTDSFSTHVLLAHVITGLIIVQYNCNLAFFDNNLLANIFGLAQLVLPPTAILSLISSAIELSPFTTDQRYL